jgi:hypothetical protein
MVARIALPFLTDPKLLLIFLARQLKFIKLALLSNDTSNLNITEINLNFLELLLKILLIT